MTDVEKLVLFKLQFFDAGENALKKFDHILPVSEKKEFSISVFFSKQYYPVDSYILTLYDSVCKLRNF